MKNIKGKISAKFSHAFRGFATSIKEESSLIVHIIMTMIVIILGIFVELSFIEWSVIILVVSIVIGLEIMNTGIENLTDLVSFQYNIKAKKVKDVGAAATMLNAMAAVLIGILIIGPKFVDKIAAAA